MIRQPAFQRFQGSDATHFVMTSTAASSRSAVPSGGICDDGRRDRIRTSIALESGWEMLSIRLAPSGSPGTCHAVA